MNEPLIEVPGETSAESNGAAPSAASGMNAWMELCVATAGQLGRLNSRALHTAMDEQRAVVLEAANERSWLGAWRLQVSYALAGVTKTAAYLRHASDIVLGAYTDAVAEAERGLNRSCMAVTGLLDDVGSGVSPLIVADDQDVATHAIGASQIVDTEGRAVSSRAL